MSKITARSVVSAFIVVLLAVVIAGTVWLSSQELSVEQVYNIAISALVILISAVCIATLLLFGRKNDKKRKD